MPSPLVPPSYLKAAHGCGALLHREKQSLNEAAASLLLNDPEADVPLLHPSWYSTPIWVITVLRLLAGQVASPSLTAEVDDAEVLVVAVPVDDLLEEEDVVATW